MNVKKIRLQKGLSVQKLANLSGLHRRTIQEIERRSDCLVSNAIAIANALEVTLDELCLEQKEIK